MSLTLLPKMFQCEWVGLTGCMYFQLFNYLLLHNHRRFKTSHVVACYLNPFENLFVQSITVRGRISVVGFISPSGVATVTGGLVSWDTHSFFFIFTNKLAKSFSHVIYLWGFFKYYTLVKLMCDKAPRLISALLALHALNRMAGHIIFH